MMSKNAVRVSDEPQENSPLITAVNEQDIRDDLLVGERKHRKANGILLIVMLVVLLVALGEEMLESPMTRITEAIICYRHYEDVDPSKLLVGREGIGPGAIDGVAEKYCKADAVQSKLAMLRGWTHLFDSVPGLLLAVPFGLAADRYGRKPFAMLGIVSLVLRNVWPQLVTWFWQAFDIRMIWLCTLSSFISGGGKVVNALFFVMVSDVASEAHRAGIFLRIGALSLAARLTMPPLSAWLMQINPWIPALSGTILQMASVFVFMLCPETLDFYKPSAVYMLPANGNPERDEIHANDAMEPVSLTLSSRSSWFYKLRTTTSFLHNDWRIVALIATFFGHVLVDSNKLLVIQYFSKRYELTISEATLLMTIHSGVMLFLFLVILPCTTKFIMRHLATSARQKDLYLARASQVLWTIGWTLVGLSPSIPLAAVSLASAALGQGMTLLTRSFLASLLSPHHIALAYSTISVVETIGNMLGSPALAKIFTLGLSLGGMWIGLPFFFIGLVSTAFTIIMFAVRLRRGEDGYSDERCQE